MRFGEWHTITNDYRKIRRKNRDAEEERAQFLTALMTQKPWLRRSTFAKEATFETMKQKTWRQIVVEELKEDFREVSNTIAVHKAFPHGTIAAHGRDVLVALYLRKKAQADRTRGLQVFTAWSVEHGAPPALTTANKILRDLWPPRKKAAVANAASEKTIKNLRLETRALRRIANHCGICAPRAAQVPVA